MDGFAPCVILVVIIAPRVEQKVSADRPHVAQQGRGNRFGRLRDSRISACNSETSTGVKQTLTSDSRGFYSFQSLPVGHYDLEVTAPCFGPLRKTGVVIDLNGKVVVDVSLAIGVQSETVTVYEAAARVETIDTQMGEVISGQQMTSVPLNGRSYTDLLGLQPGVLPVTSLTPNTQQDVGVARCPLPAT
jgi:hypothetical protein